ncbi:MAG: ABC transporter permease [Dehalococcoidia bacterium]|nr:ABC transporter permease [Dehalococcoidia bacterium]
MNGFAVFLRKELREQFKTSRIVIVAAVFLFFGFCTPLLIKYMPEILELAGPSGMTIEMLPPTSGQALAEYAGTMSQVGVLVAVLMAMGAVAREVESGTAVLVLSKPVGRLAFIIAKLTAGSFNFMVAVALGGLACFGYTFILFGDAAAMGFLWQNLLLWLFLVFCMSVTLFFSSLMKNSLAAGGLAVGVIILLSAVSVLPWVGRVLPGTLISWGNRLAMGIPGQSEWWAVTGALGLSALCVWLTWVTLRRKEL